MSTFTGKNLAEAFDAGVDAIAMECNKRIHSTTLPTHLEDSQYWKGYKDALGELVEYIKYDRKQHDGIL